MLRSTLVIIALSVACAVTQASVPVAAHGKAAWVFVEQPGAAPAERYTAEEPASARRQITGAVAPIVEAGKAPSGPCTVLAGVS